MKVNKSFDYIEISGPEKLTQEQSTLLNHARENIKNSYSPYSKFKVSASLLLDNDEVINGTNQENMAYPSGLCAERVAFYYAKARYPKNKINRLAITAYSDEYEVNHPISPCGSCRQAMLEYEIEQEKDIEIILQGFTGKIFIINKIRDLVPLHFFEEHLKK